MMPALQQRLDQHAEDVGALLQRGAPVVVGEDLLDGVAHPLPVEAELGVDDLLLLGVDQVEQQRLEAVRRPILDHLVLFRIEMLDGAVGPDLPELVVERLVGHHELHQAAHSGIVGLGVVEWRRRPSRGPRPASACRRSSCRPRACRRCRPAAPSRPSPHGSGEPQRGDVAAKAVTWRASSRVWLAAYSCAPGSRSTWQRLADRFSAPCSPCRRLESDQWSMSLASWIFWPSSQPVGHGASQRDLHVVRQDRHLAHVVRLVEVDVFLVERIPEVVVGARDDLVEGVGAVAVAVHLQHGLEVVGGDRVVGLIVGDLAHAAIANPAIAARQDLARTWPPASNARRSRAG